MELAYEEYGEGSAVVFVHGLAASSFSWRRTAQALSDEWRTICFDLMGFGCSDKPSVERYTLERQSDLVMAAIRQLGLERPALIGHSLGGGVCLSLMKNLTDATHDISRLVLVDSLCYPQSLPWFLSALKLPILPKILMALIPEAWGFVLIGRTMYHPRNGIGSEAVEDYARALASPGAHDALLSTVKQMIPQDMDGFLESYARIPVPTQIIWGEADRVIPIELGQRLALTIPNAVMHEVSKCGHCPQEERPEEVISTLRQFLKGVV